MNDSNPKMTSFPPASMASAASMEAMPQQSIKQYQTDIIL